MNSFTENPPFLGHYIGEHLSGLFLASCRLASTPAMFNSTLTEDDAFLCPVDGSIMITGNL